MPLVGRASLLLLALAVPALRAGELVQLDPRGVGRDSSNQRDEAALQNAFARAYGEDFPGYGRASRDPRSRAGAFVVFQKALILLTTDVERLQGALKSEDKSPWFDPDFPQVALSPRGTGGTIIPTGYKVTDDGAFENPPQIYAPSSGTLDRIARIAEEMRRAESLGDRSAIDRYQREFLAAMAGEIRELEGLVRSGSAVQGLGVRDVEGRLEPVRFEPNVLREGLEGLERAAAAAPGGAPPPPPATGGSARAMPPAVAAWNRRLVAKLSEPMTRAERDLFELQNAGGFHFRGGDLSEAPTDPNGETRVLTYDLYQAYPGDVWNSGLTLDARRNP